VSRDISIIVWSPYGKLKQFLCCADNELLHKGDVMDVIQRDNILPLAVIL